MSQSCSFEPCNATTGLEINEKKNPPGDKQKLKVVKHEDNKLLTASCQIGMKETTLEHLGLSKTNWETEQFLAF